MNNSKLYYRKLDPKDALAISKLHLISFSKFFLTSFGGKFLTSFYESILLHQQGIGLGVFNGNELIGFAIGTKKNSGFYKSLIKKNGFKLLLFAMPSFLRSPSKIIRLFSSLINSVSNKKYCNLACLLSICVSPKSGIKSLGSILIKNFESEMVKFGIEELVLTTDKENNEHLNHFYIVNNYICVNSFFQGEREMNFYLKKL
jgi:hypothetical protein